jgi:hypothetical protein
MNRRGKNAARAIAAEPPYPSPPNNENALTEDETAEAFPIRDALSLRQNRPVKS